MIRTPGTAGGEVGERFHFGEVEQEELTSEDREYIWNGEDAETDLCDESSVSWDAGERQSERRRRPTEGRKEDE